MGAHVKIKSEDIINFGHNVWTIGRVILSNKHGEDYPCVIATRDTIINPGDLYLMQISRHRFELMEPCDDQKEADRCNDSSSIGRTCYKVIVKPHQLKNPTQLIFDAVWESVLIRCYPDMDGPGQVGWIIDNDVEGESNKVEIFTYKNGINE